MYDTNFWIYTHQLNLVCSWQIRILDELLIPLLSNGCWCSGSSVVPWLIQYTNAASYLTLFIFDSNVLFDASGTLFNSALHVLRSRHCNLAFFYYYYLRRDWLMFIFKIAHATVQQYQQSKSNFMLLM